MVGLCSLAFIVVENELLAQYFSNPPCYVHVSLIRRVIWSFHKESTALLAPLALVDMLEFWGYMISKKAAIYTAIKKSIESARRIIEEFIRDNSRVTPDNQNPMINKNKKLIETAAARIRTHQVKV